MAHYERRNGHTANTFFNTENNLPHTLRSLHIDPGTVVTVPSTTQPGCVYDIRFLSPDPNTSSPGKKYLYCERTFPYAPNSEINKKALRWFTVWLPMEDLFALEAVQMIEDMKFNVHEDSNPQPQTTLRESFQLFAQSVIRYATQSSW